MCIRDSSYTEQIVVMTYPLIGNYGIIDEDYESKLIGPKGCRLYTTRCV